MASRADLWDKFKEHLDVAENGRKTIQSRQLHATLAQIYYKQWEKAL